MKRLNDVLEKLLNIVFRTETLLIMIGLTMGYVIVFQFHTDSRDGDITNRDHKVVGHLGVFNQSDDFESFSNNPVDVEYVFKAIQKYYPNVPNSFKQKLINGESGAWLFDKTNVKVNKKGEQLNIIISR